ncbi:MAG: restriction endonuclease, partial [Nocardioidaceae bacterium]
MTGTQFENLVRRLLERDALTKVTVAGGSADRGADVVGRTADGHRVVVQCKRYALGRKVTSPEMQLFVGMAWHEHNADRPLYVTTVE